MYLSVFNNLNSIFGGFLSMATFSLENISKSLLPARTDLHLLRKIWHMGMGSIAITLYLISGQNQKEWGWIALAVAITGFSVDFLRLRYSAMNELVVKVLGPFMRESERKDYSGLPFYAMGCGLALLLFKPHIALLSVLFLVFSDPISSYFGVKYGKTKILPNKSLQGSTAGFAVCYLITLAYGISMGEVSMNLLFFAVLAGVIGAISELMSIFVDDNLTIPVISGAGLTALNLLFQIF